jgi:hypothetical protein
MKVTIASEHNGMNEDGESKEYEEYEICSAVDCLIRAEEIKKNPDLYPLVMKELEKKKLAINSVPTSLEGLKKIAKTKIAKADAEAMMSDD